MYYYVTVAVCMCALCMLAHCRIMWSRRGGIRQTRNKRPARLLGCRKCMVCLAAFDNESLPGLPAAAPPSVILCDRSLHSVFVVYRCLYYFAQGPPGLEGCG